MTKCTSPFIDKSDWAKIAIVGREFLVVREILPPVCPPVESLKRRYDASDKTWKTQWLSEDGNDTACEDR